MSASLVTLILNILFGVVLLGGFLVGAFKGLKKSAIKTGFLAGFLILFFFLSPLISKAVCGIHINESIGSISQFLESKIVSIPEVAEIYGSNPALQELVATLPAMLVNIVIMFVLVPISVGLSSLITFIICKVQKRKQKANRYDKVYTIQNGMPVVVEKPVQTKKHKFLGGLVGMVSGFMVFFCLFMPITATARTVMEYVDTEAVASASTEEAFKYTELSNLIIDTLGTTGIGYVQAVNNSIFGKVASVGNIDYALYNTITSTTIDGHTITLRNELNAVANVMEAYIYVTNTTDENGKIDFKSLDLNKLETAVNALLDSVIVQTVGADLVEYYINEALNGTLLEDLEANGTLHEKHVNLVKLVLAPLSESIETNGGFDKQIKTDISAVFKGAKAVVDSGLVDDMDGYHSINKNSVLTAISCLEGQSENSKLANHDYLGDILSAVFESDTLKCVMVGGLNYLLDELSIRLEDMLEKQGETITTENPVVFDNVKFNGINWETTSQNLTFAVKKAVAGVKLYANNLGSDNKFDLELLINAENFDAVAVDIGKALDGIKALPLFTNTEGGENIFNQVLKQVNRLDLLNDLVDLNQENVVWEDEVTIIIPALKVLNTNHTDNTKSQTLLNELIENGAESLVETDGFKNLDKTEVLVLTDALCQSKILRPVAVVLLEELINNLANELGVGITANITSQTNLQSQSQSIGEVVYDLFSVVNTDFSGSFEDAILNNSSLQTAVKNLLTSLKANAEAGGVFEPAYTAVCESFEEIINTAHTQICELVESGEITEITVTGEQLILQFDAVLDQLSKAKAVESVGQNSIESVILNGGSDELLELLNAMQGKASGVLGVTYLKVFAYVQNNYMALQSVQNTTFTSIVWEDVLNEISGMLN